MLPYPPKITSVYAIALGIPGYQPHHANKDERSKHLNIHLVFTKDSDTMKEAEINRIERTKGISCESH